LAVYDVTKRAVERARNGGGVTLIELITYRRKGHAEHDNQSYVPNGEIDRWSRENDPLDRYVAHLSAAEGIHPDALAAIDERVQRVIDEATDEAERSAMPDPTDALLGIYAEPAAVAPLWFRERGAAVTEHERPAGWGVYETTHG
ncbi:MAG: thiamine pyrophosphate-dependent enzyme, partial [Candidatus Eremiobacteraeota bacterium]|nr:thiamine pyrophosphate-dependent enzyme [Candidatus Eremiobacteraeota bacterium]